MLNKKLVSPVLMWLIVIAGAAIIFWLAPSQELFSQNIFTYLLTISAVLYWMYFFTLSIYLNRQAYLSADKTDKLLQHGIYGVVRHPLYSSDIVLAWGVFICWPTIKVLISVIWLTLILFYWMRLEERALTEKFGDDYRSYKDQVPMFLPKILKK